MIRNILLIIIIFVSSIQYSISQNFQLSDSAKISLLTNSPWSQEVYALFGHTAIRVQDSVNYTDVVFNYGIFDFNSSNFMYRFVKGETDYIIAAMNFNNYKREYQERGVGITEQVLNLTQNEKQNIFDALVINSLPENRVYRYNYFYDNCSTRPRDIIEKNINGTILYTPTNKDQTYRDLVHECVNSQPWIRFGVDLVIGADADEEISDRQKDFLPAYLMQAYSHAQIKGVDEITKPLIAQTNDLLPIPKDENSSVINYPLLAGCLLFTISIIISFLSYKKGYRIMGKIFDTLLFLSAGIAGSIIFFLMFFSVHPCTNPNWNIAWLNPLQFIFALLFCIKFLSKYVYYYHFINFAVLTLFLLAWFLIPQYLEIAFIPYILTLWIRSGTNILEYKKNK